MSGKKRSQSKVTDIMKEELLKWLCIQHATNGPLDRDILRHKANELVRNFELTSFKCSESWLTLFLKRYHFTTNLCEGFGPIFDDFQTWVDMIRGLINQYSYDNQYHLDELTLYTDFLPSSQEHLDELPDAPVDMSTLKLQLMAPRMEQTTILLVCNATATQKQKPLVCGPYPAEDNETYTYIQNDMSRITDEILSAYLFVLNRKMAESNRGILLFMSRTRINVLKLVRLTHILPVFIPYRFPMHLRPLRQDVSHSIKMSYRKSYIARLCSPDTSHWTPQEISEALVKSWLELPRETIVVRFQRTKFRNDDSFTSFECPQWEELKTGVGFERFVTFDDNLGTAVVPVMGDFRFLTNVKHKFNLKPPRNLEVDLQPQPSTSGGSGGTPADDADGQDERNRREESQPEDSGMQTIPNDEGIVMTVGVGDPPGDSGDPEDQTKEPVTEATARPHETSQEEEDPSGTAEQMDSSIDLSAEASLNRTADIATPIKRLFTEKDSSLVAAGESLVQSEDTESLNSTSRGESTITEGLDSTLENSAADADSGITSFRAAADSFMDSGTSDSSGEGMISSSMEVEVDEQPPETSLGEASTPPATNGLPADVAFSTSSVDNNEEEIEDSSPPVLTPLVNVNIEDGSSPGAALAAEFINNPSKDGPACSGIMETSAEGGMLAIKHFGDQRIKYYVSTVGEGQVEPVGKDAETPGELKNDYVPAEELQGDEESIDVEDKAGDSEVTRKIDLPEGNPPGSSGIERNYNGIHALPDDSTQEQMSLVVGKAGIPRKSASTELSSVDNLILGSVRQSLEVSETIIIETITKAEPGDDKRDDIIQMRALTTTPVIQDEHVMEKSSYSTESALQEASRELEEKLRDLEANDPSRKISSFFDDEDNSESSRHSIEAASLLRDLLNEAKGLSDTSGLAEGKLLLGENESINYYKGLKRRREEADGTEPGKKKMMQENWAKCFENFPVFGPYNFEEGDERKSLGADVAEIEIKSQETPGPSSCKKY